MRTLFSVRAPRDETGIGATCSTVKGRLCPTCKVKARRGNSGSNYQRSAEVQYIVLSRLLALYESKAEVRCVYLDQWAYALLTQLSSMQKGRCYLKICLQAVAEAARKFAARERFITHSLQVMSCSQFKTARCPLTMSAAWDTPHDWSFCIAGC